MTLQMTMTTNQAVTFLREVAAQSFGAKASERAGGGAGSIGMIGDKVVKFNTHWQERIGRATPEMIESSNQLRQSLSAAARVLCDGDAQNAKLAAIREKLGLGADGSVVAGKGLLSRKVAAQVLHDIAALHNDARDSMFDGVHLQGSQGRSTKFSTVAATVAAVDVARLNFRANCPTQMPRNMRDFYGLQGERFNALADQEFDASSLYMDKGARQRVLTEGKPFVEEDFAPRDWARYSISIYKDLPREELTSEDLQEIMMGVSKGSFNWEGVGKTDIPELAKKIIAVEISRGAAANMTRDGVTGVLKGPSGVEAEFQAHHVNNGSTADDKSKTAEHIKEFATAMLQQHRTMTPRQLIATLKVFAQTTYAMPGYFDIRGLQRDFSIAFKGDDVKVDYHFRKEEPDGTPPIRLSYRINGEGVVQTEYLGRDEG